MKQLEIKTNKRLLIVEFDEKIEIESVLDVNQDFETDTLKEKKFIAVPKNLKYICKGSDLNEDIAKGFTHSMNFGTDENTDIGYHHSIKDNYSCGSALESFISSIEAASYHWGENPHEKELDSCSEYTDMFTIAKRARKYEEAQARTFNPSKCIIFEII